MIPQCDNIVSFHLQICRLEHSDCHLLSTLPARKVNKYSNLPNIQN